MIGRSEGESMDRMRFSAVVTIALLVATLSACGGDDEPGTSGTQSPSVTSVTVTLQEFAVIPAQASAPGGQVTFVVTNKGPDDKHELVVVRTDLDPGSLPKKADGSVDETGAGITAVGEIEEFDPNTTQQMTFDMPTGKYVLFCNVVEVDAGKTEAHYTLGMRAGFSTT
jgi:uncharacterized cupredoxin-like copper-binding protein